MINILHKEKLPPKAHRISEEVSFNTIYKGLVLLFPSKFYHDWHVVCQTREVHVSEIAVCLDLYRSIATIDVDHLVYINTPTSDVQIKALNYLRDYDNFNGLADHMPIVSTFKYEKTVENSSNTPAAANYDSVVMNGGNAFGW